MRVIKVLLLVLLISISLIFIAIGYVGEIAEAEKELNPWWEEEGDSGLEIITNTAQRWIAGECMMKDVQYWLTPWTAGNPAEEETVTDDTILGPATRVDEEGNFYLYDPQNDTWKVIEEQ